MAPRGVSQEAEQRPGGEEGPLCSVLRCPVGIFPVDREWLSRFSGLVCSVSSRAVFRCFGISILFTGGDPARSSQHITPRARVPLPGALRAGLTMDSLSKIHMKASTLVGFITLHTVIQHRSLLRRHNTTAVYYHLFFRLVRSHCSACGTVHPGGCGMHPVGVNGEVAGATRG